MFSGLLGFGFTWYAGKRLIDTVNTIGNDLLFKRTTSLNLTKSRKKNVISHEGYKTIYIHSLEKNYDRTILYLHGSGGTIHDREFICKFFDALEVNYLIVEYPLKRKNLLQKQSMKLFKEMLDQIYEYHNLEKDIIWGTSLGGMVALHLFSIDLSYKYLIHCISAFDPVCSKNDFIRIGFGIFGLTLPNNIIKQSLPNDDRKKIILYSKNDEYFAGQEKLVVNLPNIILLESTNPHACFDLKNVYIDLLKGVEIEDVIISEEKWAMLDTYRSVVNKVVTNIKL